ncbi:MAG: hypothetical protein ACRD4Y_10365 [Candidatus Acidiferrales bacterium]
MSSRPVSYSQKRRSTRIDRALPLEVQGVGALREPYHEQVSTGSVSCHGCTYQTKTEVLQGEIVYLEVKAESEGTTANSCRARVKWVQKLNSAERGYRVAVELENAGNIWGISPQPEDWFLPQLPGITESASQGRELKVVSRTETKVAPLQETGVVQSSGLGRTNPAATTLSSLGQMLAGLGEQIHQMASESAREALVAERTRQLADFRAEIQEEASKTIQSVLAASKEDISRQALKAFMEAHEAGARVNYSRWIKKIEADMETARQHMLNQVKEVNVRVDTLATATIDRVQRNMESTRNDAVDRFVSRFREQVTPLLSEANNALQSLANSEAVLKRESETLYAGLESRLESGANMSLAKAQEEMDRRAADISLKTSDTLAHLSQNIEKAAQENLRTLLASLGGQVTRILEEKSAELSREFTSGLEGYVRNYLETLGKSIAELPRNAPPPTNPQ